MSGLEKAFYVVSILAGIVTVVGIPAAARWVLRRLRFASQAENRAAVETAIKPLVDEVRGIATRMVRVEDQFGPNGGGLREAVNRVAQDTSVTKETVHGLVRRFEDHLDQSTEDRSRLSAVERSILQSRQR